MDKLIYAGVRPSVRQMCDPRNSVPSPFVNDFNLGTIYLQIKVEPKSATINAPLVSFGEEPLKVKQTDNSWREVYI